MAITVRDFHPSGRTAAIALLVLCAGLALPAAAGELRVSATDSKKVKLADVLVSVYPLAGVERVQAGRGIMDQRNSQFTPGVLPITVGSTVTFPNSDNVRHQVYSFSPAKTFDLPLYAGTPAAPVRFDKAGVVAVGCNIHDWMIGWIVVLDTPYFGKTGADGTVSIPVPAGRYSMRVWHPRIAVELAAEQIAVAEVAVLQKTLQIKLAPPAPPRRGNRRLKPMPAVPPGGTG